MNEINYTNFLVFALIIGWLFYKYVYKKYKTQKNQSEYQKLQQEDYNRNQQIEKEKLATEIEGIRRSNANIFAIGEPVYMVFDLKVSQVPENIDYDAPVSKPWLLPHLLSICWLIYDIHGVLIRKESFIVKPEGAFKIDKEIQDSQGITDKIANENGVSIQTILHGFKEDLKLVKMLISHKISWDKKVMDVEYARNKIGNPFKGVYLFCTMENTVNFCAIEHNYSKLHAKGEIYKYPSLEDLYGRLFHGKLEEETAEYNAKICSDCFFELINRGVFKIKFSVDKKAESF